MSYIDSYRHRLVGYFGHLPVYRPLEDIGDGTTDPDSEFFDCRRDQLVIGGGSGEHPGLVLLRPPAAVAAFARHSGDFDLRGAIDAELADLIGRAPMLLFAGWTDERHAAFRTLCASGPLLNRWSPDADWFPHGPLDLETWVACGLGEFVYYAMPDLASDLVERLRPLHRDKHHMRFNVILLPPPGMPVYANGGTSFDATLRPLD